MAEIIHKASLIGVNVDTIKTVNRTDVITYEVDLYVTGLEQLNKFISELLKLTYVSNVVRFMR